MHTFFFKVEVEPLPGNAQGESADGAFAHIWLRAETMEHAEQGLFAVISAYGWAPIKVVDKRLIQPEQIPYLDKQTQQAFHLAQERGASLWFVGWSKPGCQPDGVAVSLVKPPRKLLH